jgi:predicted ferric reductase
MAIAVLRLSSTAPRNGAECGGEQPNVISPLSTTDLSHDVVEAPAASPVAGSGRAGVAALAAVAVVYPVLWILAAPSGEPVGRFLGELCGAEALLLFSCSLVLATLLTPIERAFGGLDRVAVWHRHTAVAGVLLLIPHAALVGSASDPYATSFGHALGDVALIGLLVLAVWALAPGLRAARLPGPIQRMARATYEKWLTGHRLTGLFVMVAVVHGAIVDPVLRHSLLLRVVYLIVGAVGTLAYLYRELLARYVVPIYDYTVADVRRPNQGTLEIALRPVHQRLSFAPGQFVFLAVGGPDGWQRHPFSVSSTPRDESLELTIKASGDYTRDLYDQLRPGVPAKLAGPFGGFDFRQGGREQIWIAGGIGVTPFLSWIRSIDDRFDRDVDFFYSVARADDALHLDEIRAVADRHPSLRVHLVVSDTDGELTAGAVIEAVPATSSPWVYMCGPSPMMQAFSGALRKLGIPAARIRWEEFSVR